MRLWDWYLLSSTFLTTIKFVYLHLSIHIFLSRFAAKKCFECRLRKSLARPRSLTWLTKLFLLVREGGVWEWDYLWEGGVWECDYVWEGGVLSGNETIKASLTWWKGCFSHWTSIDSEPESYSASTRELWRDTDDLKSAHKHTCNRHTIKWTHNVVMLIEAWSLNRHCLSTQHVPMARRDKQLRVCSLRVCNKIIAKFSCG